MKLKSMRTEGDYKKYVLRDAADLDLGQDPKLKLMPFQVDNFLLTQKFFFLGC